MTSFEYDVQTFAERDEKPMSKFLNQAGIEGWELVSVTPTGPNHLRLFLKRERRGQARFAA